MVKKVKIGGNEVVNTLAVEISGKTYNVPLARSMKRKELLALKTEEDIYDMFAKHIPADKDGVRIAELDEMAYRKQLWNHFPITDFWRVGKGYARKLAEHGISRI